MSYYKIDIDHLKNVSVTSTANQLGIHINKQNRCFCPDAGCPDHNSRNPSACINQKNNTVHCFVCGGNWNSWTLTGLLEFGYDSRECFTRDAIQSIGKYMADELGYGGATLVSEKEQKREIFVPRMPVLHFSNGSNTPLYKSVGLLENPFQRAQVRYFTDAMLSKNSVVNTDFLDSLPLMDAVYLMFEKCLDRLEIFYSGLYDSLVPNDLLTDDAQKALVRDYQMLITTTFDYMKHLYPLLHPEDREKIISRICFEWVMTDYDKLRTMYQDSFPDIISPFLERLEVIFQAPSINAENELMSEERD